MKDLQKPTEQTAIVKLSDKPVDYSLFFTNLSITLVILANNNELTGIPLLDNIINDSLGNSRIVSKAELAEIHDNVRYNEITLKKAA